MNANMDATLNRGVTIEEGLAASEELQMNSISLKRTSKRVNRTMCWRKYMVYIIGAIALLVLIAIIIIIVKV